MTDSSRRLNTSMTDVPDELQAARERERDQYEADRFPSVLRITVTSDDDTFDAARDRARRAREGESVPRVVSFGSHSQLRGLLTDKRIELIETLMADSPASISALARQVERNYADVHADLEVLADYRVVAFEREGQARRPYIPYDRIEYSGTITRQPAPA
jgi:predicted transcriptional regulator